MRARRADDRAGAVHPGNQRLSRPALDLLAAFARRERRRPARRGGAAVVDGGVPRGRQRLGDRKGIARGAGRACARRWNAAPSDEEIKKLMDELRAALDKFMQALAEELRKNPQMARPLDPQFDAPASLAGPARACSTAWSGWRARAPRMPPSSCSISCGRCWTTCRWPSPAATRATATTCSQALDELGDMIRKQQQLRDRTFRQGQDQRRQQRGSRVSAASRATATRWASCARTSRRCATSSRSCWRN